MDESNVTVEVVDVTPELAAEWLRLNTDNFRLMCNKTISKYAAEMTLGNWHLNGETIKFDGYKVLDGQHRLHAVVNTGVTVKCVVVRNLKTSCASTIDRGKKRTLAQWLSHEGVKNTSLVAAMSRLTIAHKRGSWAVENVSNLRIPDSEILNYALDNRDVFEDVTKVIRGLKTVMPESLIGTILFCGSGYKRPSENATAKWFAESLRFGVNIADTDPVLHLRNRLVSQTGNSKLSAFSMRMLATIAWNKTVNGEPSKLLRLTLTGPNKQELPREILVAN